MSYFLYGKEEIDTLSAADGKMAALIQKRGHIYRPMYDGVFKCVVMSIAGQQISNKALETVVRRLVALVGDLSPNAVASVSTADIQACGLSLKKAGWIKSFAAAVAGGSFDILALRDMSDIDVINSLCAFDGVGLWTAEMTLIFALGRKDVFSYGDFGIRKGLALLTGEKPDKKMFEQYRQKFTPYGTVASFYLWALASGEVTL